MKIVRPAFRRSVRTALLSFLLLSVSSGSGEARIGDCGHPVSSGANPTATDSLAVLRSAVGIDSCDTCTCDADGSGAVVATDALLILRIAVGLDGDLRCEPCPGDVVPPEVVTPGSASGYVFQTNPVVVIPDPAEAPAGSNAVDGAEVRALGRNGDLVGQATTAADGGFIVSSLPTGYVKIEVRVDGAQQDPDVTVDATIIPDATVELGRVWPIDRVTASASALSGVGSEALVAGSMNPFPADSVVYPEGNDETGAAQNSDAFTLDTDSWFFFVDPSPLEEFSHDVEFVLVDAETGAVERRSETFPPVVNHASLWSASDDLYSYSEFVFALEPADYPPDATATPTPEMVQVADVPDDPDRPDAVSEFPAPIDPSVFNGQNITFESASSAVASMDFNNTGADGVFFVGIRGGTESHFYQNYGRMASALLFEGVSVSNMAFADFTKVDAPVVDTSELTGEESMAVRDEAMRALVRPAVLQFEPQIQARLMNGDHSTLIVYLASHGGGGEIFMGFGGDGEGSWFLNPKDMGIEETLACRVRVITQSCKSEKFQQGLAEIFAATEHDVKVFASAAADQNALYTPGWATFLFSPVIGQGGSHYTTRFASLLDIEDGDVASVSQDDGNGNIVQVDSLAELSGSPPPPYIRPSRPSWCFPEDCGNNMLESPPEECDGTADQACPNRCNDECRCEEPFCGDGIHDPPAEECDGADANACPNRCDVECMCVDPFCGDGIHDPPAEECDGADADDCMYGCAPGCECALPECGNDVVEGTGPGAEQCDGTDDAACPGRCTEICVCLPEDCGDNFTEPPEDCDGTDDDACPGLCTADCECPDPVCGNGIVENGERCDGEAGDCGAFGCTSECQCDWVADDFEFQVNTYTSGEQRGPYVDMDDLGRITVTWNSFSTGFGSGQDGSLSGVYYQSYDSNGDPIGEETRANDVTLETQVATDISVVRFNGVAHSAIAFDSFEQDGDGWATAIRYAKEFGSIQSVEVSGSQSTAGDQRDIAIGFLAEQLGLSLMSAYQTEVGETPETTDRTEIMSRRPLILTFLTADDTGIAPNLLNSTDEFQVNSYTTGYQARPAMCGQDDGNFVVVWTSIGQDFTRASVIGRRVNVDTGPIGSEFVVNSNTTAAQDFATVCCSDDGFVVAWTNDPAPSLDGDQGSISARRFDASGIPLGTEFLVHQGTSGFQVGADVGCDEAGNFVVAWTNRYGSEDGAFMRGFAADGTPLTDDILLDANGQDTAVAMQSDGRTIAAWSAPAESGGIANEVFAQRFTIPGIGN